MFLNSNANNYFACSEEAGEWLFGKKIINNNQLKIFKNAINCTEFKFNEDKRKWMRKELGLENKLVIGHVGRFNPQKNHKFLIDIFNEVYKKNKESVLLLVGEGDLLEEMKKYVNKLQLEEAVKFLGLRSDIADLMQSMDVFLFPSKYEGLGVVLIEAQAAGLRCLTSKGTPKEADVTDTVEFLSLEKSAKEWAKIILEGNNNRNSYIKSINDKGYDVETNINWLTNFYIDESIFAME